MPQKIYTVEIDGTQYDIEGDRPPTEAEARQAIGASKPEDHPITFDPPQGPSRRERIQRTGAIYGFGGDNDRAGINMLAGGVGATALTGPMLRGAGRMLTSPVVRAGLKGAAENIPILGPIGRGAIRAAGKMGRTQAASAAKAAEDVALKARGVERWPGDQLVHLFKDMPPNPVQIAKTSQVAGLPAGQAADTGMAGLRNWILHNLRAK